MAIGQEYTHIPTLLKEKASRDAHIEIIKNHH